MAVYYSREVAACRPFEYGGKIWLWSYWCTGNQPNTYPDGGPNTNQRWALRSFAVGSEEEATPLSECEVQILQHEPLLHAEPGDTQLVTLGAGDIEWDERGFSWPYEGRLLTPGLETHVLCGRYSVLVCAPEGVLVGVDLDAPATLLWALDERDPASAINRVYWPILWDGTHLVCGYRQAARTHGTRDAYEYTYTWGDDGPTGTEEVRGFVAGEAGLLWLDPETATGSTWVLPETGDLWESYVPQSQWHYTTTTHSSHGGGPPYYVSMADAPRPPAYINGLPLHRFSLRFTLSGMQDEEVNGDYEAQGIWASLDAANPHYWTTEGSLGSTFWLKDGEPYEWTPLQSNVGGYSDTSPSILCEWRCLYGGDIDPPILQGGRTRHALTRGCLYTMPAGEETESSRIVILGPLAQSVGDMTPAGFVWRGVRGPQGEGEDAADPETVWTRDIAQTGQGRAVGIPICVGEHVYTLIQDLYTDDPGLGPVRLIVLAAATGEVLADEAVPRGDASTLYHELLSDSLFIYAQVGGRLLRRPLFVEENTR